MILTGQISRYGSGRFGFIRSGEGREYFFYKSQLSPELRTRQFLEETKVQFQSSGEVPPGKACAVATHIREERA